MAAITQDQERDLIAVLGRPMAVMILASLRAGQRPAGPVVNNIQPVYVANNDYDEAIDGAVVQHLTVNAVQTYFETTLALSAKHIHALREEGITHPHDLAQFTSTEFEAVIRSVKGRAPLPGLAVVRLKQSCDFFQYLQVTNRAIKSEYLTHNSIKSHAVQYQALKDLKDSSKVAKLTKLSTSTDVLSWMDSFEKQLRGITGIDHSPLAYLLREDPVVVPPATDMFLLGKCYSDLHGSLCEELVNRKSHSCACVEIDKVALYHLLCPALQDGPLESALQPYEKSKDGILAIKSMYAQHGGKPKWEKAHSSQVALLTLPWTSAKNTCSLTNHIAKFRSIVMDITRCCKHIGRTPPTERELVLLLIGSITSTDPTLTAHIAMVTSDPTGLGMRFEDTATNLMLANPLRGTEYKPLNRKQKRATSVSSTLSGREGTGVDLHWYPAKKQGIK